jgi:hypothetical protein
MFLPNESVEQTARAAFFLRPVKLVRFQRNSDSDQRDVERRFGLL